jgi:mRNA-degrading endonuclease HigB of HigAB toxin-antitoxin module
MVSSGKQELSKGLRGNEVDIPATDKVGDLHVFDIGGNKLRLIAFVSYRSQRLYIKHVLDHREYDRGNGRRERYEY